MAASRRREFDLGVYLVTDRDCCGPRGAESVVRSAIANGATLVQLRDKAIDARPMLELGRSLLAFLRPAGIGLIVNDRVDVALALDADGVHIGQDDIPYPDARRLLGPDRIIGLSVGSAAHAREASGWDVDYVGIAPAYATATKSDAGAALGVAETARLAGIAGHRAVAIGGIDAGNAGALYAAGLEGVAVVSAICAAADPGAATRAIVAVMRTQRTRPPGATAPGAPETGPTR